VPEYFYQEAVPPPSAPAACADRAAEAVRDPQTAADLRAQQHRLAALRRNDLRQRGEQFRAVARVAPGAAIPAEMEAAGRAATQISRAAACRLMTIFEPSANSISSTPPAFSSKSASTPLASRACSILLSAAPASASKSVSFMSASIRILCVSFFSAWRSRCSPAAGRRAAVSARQSAAGIKPAKPAPAKPIPYPRGDDTEQN